LNDILFRMQAGTSRAHFVMATGLGKTVVAAEVIRHLFDKSCATALVLCHSQDLALQLERAFWPHLKASESTSVFLDGTPPQRPRGVTFGLYQTMVGYLPSMEPRQYDIIIIDEAHHALAAGFLACINHMNPKLLLGMTATPWRGDGDSIDRVFGAPLARVSLVDGMAMGYLAEVDYRILCDNIDWPQIPQLSSKKLSIRDLNKRLFLPQRDDAVIQEITQAAAETQQSKMLVYSPSVSHAGHFANLLSAAGIPARSVSGIDRLARQRALMEFAAGKLTALVAVDVLNEGIDVPDVNILAFMRATHSRRIFVQQLGRGLRLAEGKRKVVVLDFVSDIRRLAEVTRMDHEARNASLSPEALYLRDGFVRFRDLKTKSFVDEWLRDIADVSDASDNHELTFPVVA
jgi:superfamily II DNA or RNA helicase